MRNLGNKVTIMVSGVITAKELRFDGEVTYRVESDNGRICFVTDKNIVKEEIEMGEPHVVN